MTKPRKKSPGKRAPAKKAPRRIHLWDGATVDRYPPWKGRPVGEPPWQRGACGAIGHDMVTDPKAATCRLCRNGRIAHGLPPFRELKKCG